MKRILISIGLLLSIALGSIAFVPHEASASLSSCTYLNRNPYVYGENVDGYNRLNCQTISDRQAEYCLVFQRGTSWLWYCFDSPESAGYSFSATAAVHTCYSPSAYVQYYFADRDYWSGQTWSGYGPVQYLGRWPC